MKQQHSDSNKRIPRIFHAIICIALIKLSLLGYYGLMGQEVATSTVATLARIPIAQAAESTQKPAAQSKQQAASSKGAPGEKGESLSAKWEEIKQKQVELRRREESLRALERSLDAKLVEQKKIQTNIKKMLEDANVLKDKKIKHLIEVYSNMKAKQAALVLETLDEEIAVKILSGMRGRKAGEILSFVKPEKAALLSERLTDLRIPFED